MFTVYRTTDHCVIYLHPDPDVKKMYPSVHRLKANDIILVLDEKTPDLWKNLTPSSDMHRTICSDGVVGYYLCAHLDRLREI